MPGPNETEGRQGVGLSVYRSCDNAGREIYSSIVGVVNDCEISFITIGPNRSSQALPNFCVGLRLTHTRCFIVSLSATGNKIGFQPNAWYLEHARIAR